MIASFPMFIDLHVTFAMLSLCLPNDQATYNILYFHHQVSCNVIPNLMFIHNYVRKTIRLRILWHHNGPFGLLLGHFSYFFKGVRPSFNGLTSYFAFLGCWALIALTLVFHFQQDDHLTLFYVVAHVKTDIYPFQVALQDTSALLPRVVQSHVLPFKSLIVQSYYQM